MSRFITSVVIQKDKLISLDRSFLFCPRRIYSLAVHTWVFLSFTLCYVHLDERKPRKNLSGWHADTCALTVRNRFNRKLRTYSFGEHRPIHMHLGVQPIAPWFWLALSACQTNHIVRVTYFTSISSCIHLQQMYDHSGGCLYLRVSCMTVQTGAAADYCLMYKRICGVNILNTKRFHKLSWSVQINKDCGCSQHRLNDSKIGQR